MTPAARVQAAIEILDQIGAGKPAEQALTGWARRSRFAGSGDRAAVRDHVFDVLRRQASAAQLGGGTTGRALMLGLLRARGEIEALFDGARFGPQALDAREQALLAEPMPELVPDVPDWVLPHLRESLGDRLDPVLAALRDRAPLHLRINLRNSDMARAQQSLRADGIETQPIDAAPAALEVTQGARKLRQSAAYLQGHVELQDGASQAVVAAMPLRDGARVLDYCAGGGGKALAMADRADIQLEAHDIAPERMRDLPVRAERAGVAVRCVEAPQGIYDLVLCDVPCSGSGAWRRAPDGKWRLTQARLNEVLAIQDDILDRARDLVAPGGVLAYATCSLLDMENDARIAAFLQRNPDWMQVFSTHWRPDQGVDGFFTAHLTRKSAG